MQAIYDGLTALGAPSIGFAYSGECIIGSFHSGLWDRVEIPAGRTLDVRVEGREQLDPSSTTRQPPQAYIVDGCTAPGTGLASFDDVRSYPNETGASQ